MKKRKVVIATTGLGGSPEEFSVLARELHKVDPSIEFILPDLSAVRSNDERATAIHDAVLDLKAEDGVVAVGLSAGALATLRAACLNFFDDCDLRALVLLSPAIPWMNRLPPNFATPTLLRVMRKYWRELLFWSGKLEYEWQDLEILNGSLSISCRRLRALKEAAGPVSAPEARALALWPPRLSGRLPNAEVVMVCGGEDRWITTKAFAALHQHLCSLAHPAAQVPEICLQPGVGHLVLEDEEARGIVVTQVLQALSTSR